ncbi:hypothetical protein [Actinomadura rupiterrae]|uniref:hypothetical protein n=1 Tax=Actinomadura rupiterrae TaxID=559627 RepID=UPI0020A51EBC|nr:hypothetical protein [Actinomadura rupiterrae]MCP2335424.1 hypothetical protein [Actinomadura rupiterrae]
MSRTLRRGFAASTGVAALIALGAVPASAATWTVTGATSSTATSTTVHITDSSTGASTSCDSSTIKVTWAPIFGHPDAVGRIDAWTFSSTGAPSGYCLGPLGLLIKITVVGLPYYMVGGSYSFGTARGSIPGARFTIASSDGCQATLGGPGGGTATLGWTYTNSGARLTISGGDLVVQTVNASCDPALINAGDGFSMDGSYLVTPPVTITSP